MEESEAPQSARVELVPFLVPGGHGRVQSPTPASCLGQEVCSPQGRGLMAHQVARLQSPPGAHLPKKMPSQSHVSHTARSWAQSQQTSWQMKLVVQQCFSVVTQVAKIWKTLVGCSSSSKNRVGQVPFHDRATRQ